MDELRNNARLACACYSRNVLRINASESTDHLRAAAAALSYRKHDESMMADANRVAAILPRTDDDRNSEDL